MADAWLETLSLEECLEHLRDHEVGRIAVVVNGFPILLPVNFRVAEHSGGVWIALRTRPGGIIDRAALPVALEIDGIDPYHHAGWSVLVRGTLQHVDADAADFKGRFDPAPWLTDRDSWLMIEPFEISGRRLHQADSGWSFHPDAYL
jgi:nitroimidazol reductase NimA-like FMN-containing flavoprotein (pyridoxamine 5'-phosphate oxidase superfamily)